MVTQVAAHHTFYLSYAKSRVKVKQVPLLFGPNRKKVNVSIHEWNQKKPPCVSLSLCLDMFNVYKYLAFSV